MIKKIIRKSFEIRCIGNLLFIFSILFAFILAYIKLEDSNIKNIFFIILVLLGFFFGLANINRKDSNSFIIAIIAIVLLLMPFLPMLIQTFEIKSQFLGLFFRNILLVLVPAGIVLALKTIFSKEKN